MQTYDIQVRPMRTFGSDVNGKVAAILVDRYEKELASLSKDRENLISAFTQIICSDVFYIAILNHEIVGILACSNNQKRALTIDKEILRKSFGYVKGSIAYKILKYEFNEKLPYQDDTGYIECVATVAKARQKGVSTSLFRYVKENAQYQRYILQVVDTNENAYRLYTKLGFLEVKRKKERFSKFKSFKERVYMELPLGS